MSPLTEVCAYCLRRVSDADYHPQRNVCFSCWLNLPEQKLSDKPTEYWPPQRRKNWLPVVLYIATLVAIFLMIRGCQ